MTYSAQVRLHWLHRSGSASPLGQHFARPARFDHQGDDWIDNAWSLVIDVAGMPDSQGYQIAAARFLMPTAPQAWLSAGRRFVLFDGRDPIAEGEVRQASVGRGKASRRRAAAG